jgi:Na+-transporting methylmalonyl-CoA/oxaloacetate decarboxylase gamma subunit
MNEANIIQQGFILTVIGMGFVFLFLAGTICAINCLKHAAVLLDRYLPPNPTAAAQADEGAIALAIAFAKKNLNKK